ncbi:N-formylglutamate amidohydrolase [Roseobacter ponti]|uniref:N-formylglutamate amidohydrolase n=1 Tax=Roseobacter ponti TaxID=1891787 RepID=A0A858SWF0_9RHOB|nr:N-formylglutamate amidohydrolase [Roseobacter ponti]QJF52328.1 N-formylglutamate amidohydrolase [Roseobacter ponti]
MDDLSSGKTLLAGGDPPPVEWVNRESTAPVLLLCEHAGQAIPAALAGLGLPKGAVDLHIGWDIGAERLARSLAAKLSAPLILQRYSRLVIDCNRPAGTPGSVPEISDHVVIPGNSNLSQAARREREMLIFGPLNEAIVEGFAQAPRRAAFSIHSFTRQMRRGDRREWDAGFLCRHDLATAQVFLDTLSRMRPGLSLAVNEPYQIEEDGDWFIPHHAEPRGIAHCLIEVCNDQLHSDEAVGDWAGLLARAIDDVLRV